MVTSSREQAEPGEEVMKLSQLKREVESPSRLMGGKQRMKLGVSQVSACHLRITTRSPEINRASEKNMDLVLPTR